ncbi:MAG: purine-binding chemotaxis protein CheW [Lachnospiraceae bacterium]|nr:purine-binding chemotaxis protein CheW [Lachnospiraceae bacterium]
MKEVVVFFLSGKEYGIEVSNMQGLENYREMVSLSEAPEYLKGVVVIRKESIPVVDIKKLLMLPPAEKTGETKYLVVRTSHGKMAFLADGVSRIFRVEGEDAQNFPPLAQPKTAAYIESVAICERSLVLVLDPEKLLGDEEWEAISELMDNMEDEND